ncbi:MAG: DUF3617 domain-containing protein [Novosphingobium sp.]
MKSVTLRFAAGIAVAAAAFALPAFGQRASLAMLDGLEAGRWELHVRDPGKTVEQICFRDARRLIQLRHPADTCERLIIDDTASKVTVQYTCRGRGYGRTLIRRETGRLVQIESQGIANGLPFSFSAEARRVGDCAA